MYGGRIYLKREDLNHTGVHKLNHCMGEGLLAKYMGKKKLIVETGAGQHGVSQGSPMGQVGRGVRPFVLLFAPLGVRAFSVLAALLH